MFNTASMLWPKAIFYWLNNEYSSPKYFQIL
jgi:hypothetical protein